MDFYVRLFVRVYTSANEVKKKREQAIPGVPMHGVRRLSSAAARQDCGKGHERQVSPWQRPARGGALRALRLQAPDRRGVVEPAHQGRCLRRGSADTALLSPAGCPSIYLSIY